MPIIQTDKTLRPREKNDFYPTPIEFCRAAVRKLPQRAAPRVLDPGAGKGPWGLALREQFPLALIHGVEIDFSQTPEFLIPGVAVYDRYEYADFLNRRRNDAYDFVVGNPPYKYAIEFIEKSKEQIDTQGCILFLLGWRSWRARNGIPGGPRTNPPMSGSCRAGHPSPAITKRTPRPTPCICGGRAGTMAQNWIG